MESLTEMVYPMIMAGTYSVKSWTCGTPLGFPPRPLTTGQGEPKIKTRMCSWRAIRRVVADPQPLLVFAVLGLALALGFALDEAREWGFEKASSYEFAAPCAPLPLSLKSAQEPRLLWWSHSCLPGEASRRFDAGDKQYRTMLYPGEQHREALREFCPLYRRPPPTLS